MLRRPPIFFPSESSPVSEHGITTFAYCDSANKGLFHYITHLRSYEHFLRQLPGFQFIYASPSSAKFQRAEQFFCSLFDDNSAANALSVARYFRVRRLWDDGKHSLLTRADRDLLRYGNQRYRDESLESAYRKWVTGSSEEGTLEGLLSTQQTTQKWAFRTHLLPRDYDIFTDKSDPERRTGSSGECSVSRSASRSDEERTKHFWIKEQNDGTPPKTVRGKNRFMAGRDPILPASRRAKSPSGLRGSRPATEYALRFVVRCFAAYEHSRSHSQLLPDRLSGTCLDDWKGSLMPLLKPPEPQIATRKFFIRIEEPLAVTMERYAEFLGTDNLDHVVGQALQFIFKRDTQFKSWLARNPEAKPGPARSKNRPKPEAANGASQ